MKPKYHFRYPPKRPKWVVLGVYGYFGDTKNGTSGARIKILRPLHFIDFGHFPIEIPIEAEINYHHGKERS